MNNRVESRDYNIERIEDGIAILKYPSIGTRLLIIKKGQSEESDKISLLIPANISHNGINSNDLTRNVVLEAIELFISGERPSIKIIDDFKIRKNEFGSTVIGQGQNDYLTISYVFDGEIKLKIADCHTNEVHESGNIKLESFKAAIEMYKKIPITREVDGLTIEQDTKGDVRIFDKEKDLHHVSLTRKDGGKVEVAVTDHHRKRFADSILLSPEVLKVAFGMFEEFEEKPKVEGEHEQRNSS